MTDQQPAPQPEPTSAPTPGRTLPIAIPRRLTGRQRERLVAALVDAFPTWGDLAQVASFLLEVNLQAIAPATNLGDAAFELVRWAESHDCLAKFVAGAREANPGNARLLVWTADEEIKRDSPYRGLLAFREDDADLFFGREAFVERLAAAVAARSVVAVVGPSGSGKSSVVFAGLVPWLRREGGWLVVDFRPGALPFEALAAGLLPLLEDGLDETDRLAKTPKLAGALRQGDINLRAVLERIRDKSGGAQRLLLVADQFEELYAAGQGVEEQRAFLDALLAPFTLPPHGKESGATLLLTLRADFLGHALSYSPMADALRGAPLGSPNSEGDGPDATATDPVRGPGLELLGPMSQDELRAAIERPAGLRGVDLEPVLTDRMLKDVADEPGHLPLVEFTLTQLWEEQEGARLTYAAYEAIGGIEGSLASHAEETYGRLTEPDRERVRRVFVQLVRPGVGAPDTRRRATREELGEEAWQLATQLASDRLVVTGRDEATREETVEIAHEALIREWPTLGSWMAQDRDFRTWQERLRVAVDQWDEGDHDDGALLRGGPLAEAERWLRERGAELSTPERGFVAASVVTRRRMRRRWLVTVATIVSVILLLSSGFSTWALLERGRAERRARDARLSLSGQLALQAENAIDVGQNPDLALLLAIEALGVTSRGDDPQPRVPAAEQALRRALAESGGRVLTVMDKATRNVATSGDGRWLVVDFGRVPPGEERQFGLWDLSGVTDQPEPVFLEGAGGAVGFSPDSRWLIAGSRLWDLTSTELHPKPVDLTGIDDPVDLAAFSPQTEKTRWLVTGGRSSTPHLWDLAAPNLGSSHSSRALTGLQTPATVFAFSPDGRWLVTAGPLALLWELKDTASHASAHILAGHTRPVTTVALSPDSRWLVTASGDCARGTDDFDSTARLWDLMAIRPWWDLTVTRRWDTPYVLGDHRRPVTAAVFSPDSTRLFTGDGTDCGEAGPPRAWALPPGNPTKSSPLVGPAQEVELMAVNANGRELVVVGGDRLGTSLWSLAEDSGPGRQPTHVSYERAIVSSDGRWLVTEADSAQSLQVLDLSLEDPASVSRFLRGHAEGIHAAAISPDNQRLITVSDDLTVRIWSLARATFAASPDAIEIPDGKWEVDPSHHWLFTANSTEKVTEAFTSECGLRLSGRTPTTARLLDLTADGPAAGPIVLGTYSASFNDRAFSVDGRWLAAAAVDGTVRIWDLAADNPAADARTFCYDGEYVKGLSISSDGHWLVTGSVDRSVRIWKLAADDPSTAATVVAQPEALFLPQAFFARRSRWLIIVPRGDPPALWSLTGEHPTPIALDPQPAVDTHLVSDDGSRLAIVSADGTVRVWDLTATDPATVATVIDDRKGQVGDVAFSADGRWLAISRPTAPLTVRLWDLEAKDATAHRLDVEVGLIDQIILSADGSWLAATGKNGGAMATTVELYDLSDTKPDVNPIVLRSRVGLIRTISFSPDGRRLAAGVASETAGAVALLWEIDGPDLGSSVVALPGPRTHVVARIGGFHWVEFSRDGRWLIYRVFDNRLGLGRFGEYWSLDLASLVDLACQTAGRNMTEDEWNRYFFGVDYRKTCPGLPGGDGVRPSTPGAP